MSSQVRSATERTQSSHPLDITPPPAAKSKKFLQPRFKQIGPVGDDPRIIMAAQSGMGKTTAALVLLKEYLRIVDLVWLVSGTIDVDPAYKEAKAMVTQKYKTEGIDIAILAQVPSLPRR